MHVSTLIKESIVLYSFAGCHRFLNHRVEYATGKVLDPDRITLSVSYCPHLDRYYASPHSCESIRSVFLDLRDDLVLNGFNIEDKYGVSSDMPFHKSDYRCIPQWQCKREKYYTQSQLKKEILCLEL